MQIELTDAQAATLIRCLRYGEAAVSVEECNNGIAETIHQHIHQIQAQLPPDIIPTGERRRKQGAKQ